MIIDSTFYWWGGVVLFSAWEGEIKYLINIDDKERKLIWLSIFTAIFPGVPGAILCESYLVINSKVLLISGIIGFSADTLFTFFRYGGK